MKKNKIIATFMIFLVLTIPVFSGAQSINIDKYSGKDNVDGIIRERNDQLSVEVTAKKSDSGEISPDEMWLASQKKDVGYTPDYKFNSCEPLPDGAYKCKYSQNNPRPKNYQVQLGNAKKDFSIRVDRDAPTVEEVSYSFTDAGKIKVKYRITDSTVCSGIKNAEFYVSTGKTKTPLKNINGGQAQCTLDDEFETSYSPSQSLVQGKICAKATDYFGQISDEECDTKEFVYDKKSPLIKSLKIMSAEGNYELTHLNADEENAQLVVEIEPDTKDGVIDVTKDTITADLSSLNPDEQDRKPDSQNGNKFIWDFTIKKTDNCKYTIKASDIQGNKAPEKTVNCKLPLDKTAPTVKEFKTIPEVIGKEGNITILFEDLDDEGNEGIGIDKNGVEAQIEGIGRKNADDCAKSADKEWRCDWKVKISSSGEKEVTVYAEDNFGNKPEPYVSKITVDLDAPELGSLSVEYAVVGGTSPAVNYPTFGDTIKFTLKGKDVNSAEADFSPIGGSKMSVSCEKSKCIFDPTVRKSGEYKTKINFIAIDKAGNKQTIEKSIQIYGIVGGKPRQDGYWTVQKVECSPSKIDRTLTALSPEGYPVYCQVSLESAQDVSVASVSVRKKDCSGDLITGGLREEIEVINDGNSPYLVFKLEQKQFKGGEATITCPITIYTLKGNKLDKAPEKETIESKITFSGESLDDLYSSTENEIKRAIKKTEWDSDVVGKLKELLLLFERICQLKSLFVVVATVWHWIQGAFATVENTPTPPTKAAGKVGRIAGCTSEELFKQQYTGTWIGYLDPFCKMLSCSEGISKYCKEWQETLTPPEAKKLGVQAINIKESLVWSTVCLCVPGIVHNLDKAKQIDCRYATCVIEDYKGKGIPLDECKQMRSEMECSALLGELWNLIPLTTIIDKIADIVTKMVTDPIFWVKAVIGNTCKIECGDPIAAIPWYCTTASLVSIAGEAYTSIKDAETIKDLWTRPIRPDYCDRLDKIKGPYEEKKAEESGGEE